jgi:hypothetical protein
MRALQKASALGQADGLGISFNPDTGVYSLILSTTGGVDIGGSGVELKLADASLQSTSGGVSVHPGSARGLSTDGSGLGIKLATNPGLSLSSSGLTLLEADSSLSLAAGGAAVALNTTGGLQTSSGVGLKLVDTSLVLSASGVKVNPGNASLATVTAGLEVQLDDTSGLSNLLTFDFTGLTVGTQVGAIGGSGATWLVCANNFEPQIPDGSQVNTAMTIQAGTPNVAGAATSANATQALYVPTLAIGANFTITLNVIPSAPVAGGVSGAVGIFFRSDKTGFTAFQGIVVEVYTDIFRIQDLNGGAVLGTTTYGSSLSATTRYDLVLTVTGNSFTATINGNTVSGTSSHNSTNTGLGFFLGKFVTAQQGACTFKVDVNGSPTNSGLQVGTGSHGLSVKLDGASLSISSAGVKVAPVLTTKGDIYVFDTANDRLAVGADNKGLIADSTQATGLRWAGRVYQIYTLGTGIAVAVKNTTARTASVTVSFAFPANFWTANKALRFRLVGSYTTTGSPSLSLGLFWVQNNGTFVSLDGNFQLSPVANSSGNNFVEDLTTFCQSTGVSGAFAGAGSLVFQGSAGQGAFTLVNNPTIDTTQAGTIQSTFTWTAASNSNSVTTTFLMIEVIEPN